MSDIRKNSSIVGLAVIGSRLMGLVREVVFAAMFKPGKYLDAYLAAFQIPNLMRDLFAEGALSTAFTTTFTKIWEKDGEKPAWALANLLISTMVLAGGAICLLGIALSGPIVQVTNFGFHEVAGKFELTVELTRILFPFILFVSMAAVVMGVLNARFIFGLPASASTVFNIVSVVLGAGLAYLFDPNLGERSLYGLCLGVLAGGLAQLAFQLPTLWKLGFRFKWHLDLKNEALRNVWRLMWPSVIAGSAIQVNVLINGMFASEIDGARSWLNCAFRLMQFPIGVFGVAIATATLPAVSRAHAKNDMALFGATVEESLRLGFFLTIPAAAGLFALAPEIIGVIYQHGRFSAADTAMTALALRGYAIGLAGYAAVKVLNPCFYALDKPRIPLLVGLVGVCVNLALNALLVKRFGMGHLGLAISTGVLALLSFLQLVFYLRRYVRFGSAAAWWEFGVKVCLCAAACGALAWLAANEVSSHLCGFSGRLVALAAGVAVGTGVFAALAFVLGIGEARSLLRRTARTTGL